MENLNIREDVSDIVNKTELLADLQIGFWIIEYPNDGIPKMYGDTIMYSLLGGNSNTLTPEELYSFCMERIDSEYIGLVFDAIENIKKNKRTEIRYPWRHEEKGWTWVRCGGFLDKSYKNGIRFKGYYHDITDELEMDIKNNEHKIIDFKKLRLYSPYFIENCEGLFEIDIDSLEIKTIFYKKKKYHKIDDGDNVFSVIRKWTHPNDITHLDNIFVSASLEQIINKKKIKQIEFKTKTIFGDYTWVEARIFCAQVMGIKKLLFYIYDISDRKTISSLVKEKEEILDAFFNLYSTIVEVDLATKKLHILKSVLPTNNDHDQKIFSLKQFLLLLEKRLIINFEKKELENFLTIDNLRLLSKTQKTSHLDLRFQKELENYEWVQLKTLYLPKNNEKIYLVFSNVDREHIINSITEKFVYKKGDYLYYLDTKNGYFSNFSITDNGTVIPPQEGNNYTQAMIKYTRQNTVLEDQDRVIEQLTPEYILNRLQEQSVYKIELGMLDENKEYRRKLITVQYYDEENKIVLIRRSDITKEYLKQKNQENKLKAIKKAADTDALTGIYNRIGAQRLIVEYLHKSNNQMSAFIIIDLDNFKKINDSLGHLQGDEVLKQVANILKENFRKTDIIARLGGDEFIVFMKNIVQKENAIISLNNLLKKLRLPYQWHEETILITGSIGVAVAPIDGATFEVLYKNADQALYNSKYSGKNGFSFYNEH